MRPFLDFLRPKLESSGYKTVMESSAGDMYMESPDREKIWVCYLSAELSPEKIRRCFEFSGHVLFVVDDKLIPQEITDRQSTPMWLRVLHGLYMGRIYTWNGRFLYGLHFDYDNGVINESGIIQPDELLLTEETTWLRGWTDTYKIARFYDRAWWMPAGSGFYGQAQREQTRQQYQNYHRRQWTPPGDSGYESPGYQDWKQKQERAKRTQYDSSGWAYDPNDWPNGKPPDPPKPPPQRDFGREFRACNDLMAVKALYRQLAREFHPDLNPDRDTTIIMQAINAAYDRAKLVYA